MNLRLRGRQGANLYRSSGPIASARAHWLTELGQALDEADRLVILLGGERPQSDELIELRKRIVAVRGELDALRSAGVGEVRCEIGPDWTNFATWQGN